MAKAIAEEHGAATLLSICPTRKSTASCYLLLNLYLRGSCHSSIHLCLSVSCDHGCSDFCSLLQHCSASCRKTSALPCVLYTSQHAVSLLIPSFSHSAYTQTNFLSSRSLLHLHLHMDELEPASCFGNVHLCAAVMCEFIAVPGQFVIVSLKMSLCAFIVCVPVM